MASSRKNLIATAYGELEDILQSEENLPLDDEGLLTQIIEKVKSKKDYFIHDTWVLAQGLMVLDDEDKMWYLIREVWVEMLCFSASRCRGYLHAKSLGSGMEFLSVVCLLLAHAVRETFPVRLKRRQQLHLPKKKPQRNREDGGSGTSLSDPQGLKPLHLKEEEDVATLSGTPRGEGSNAPELKEIVVSP